MYVLGVSRLVCAARAAVHQRHVNALVANLFAVELRDGVTRVIDGRDVHKSEARVVWLHLDVHV